MTELNIYFVKKIYKNFHDGIKYIFCGKFLHSPNFFEKWIFKLVVVLVHIILWFFGQHTGTWCTRIYRYIHDVRSNIYGTHHTDIRHFNLLYIWNLDRTIIMAYIKFPLSYFLEKEQSQFTPAKKKLPPLQKLLRSS